MLWRREGLELSPSWSLVGNGDGLRNCFGLMLSGERGSIELPSIGDVSPTPNSRFLLSESILSDVCCHGGTQEGSED